MPIPTPHAKEVEADFIARCAGDASMNKDYTDDKQRVAICYRQWRDAQAKKSAFSLMREMVTDFRAAAAKMFG